MNQITLRKSLYWQLGWLFLLGIILGLLFSGCTLGNQRQTDVYVGRVGGDLWIRSIADGAQMNTGNSSVDANTPGMPTAGIPPIGLAILGNNSGQSTKVQIDSVSGSFYVESALYGAQGVPIPDALEKLFTPGNPFQIEEALP